MSRDELSVPPELLALVACPQCRADLRPAPAPGGAGVELVCTDAGCGLAYPVVDGIPQLLIGSARRPGA